ncbi:helix-turn-helix domain-containing protein [Leptolyngbya sp. CCNP1308]|uniref:helix-turn-helix domain-containing protein n=1 Tax=Leptolyngbya sp. CCNP1308 TaxID=3110255 RepID=UPI003A599667
MFHCRLKEYLDAAGHNREWLINETGLGYATVHKLYRGPVKQISAKTFLALKKTFDLDSVEDIFTLTED